MSRSRPLSLARAVGKGVVYLAIAAILLVGIALLVLETPWAKNQLRGLIVGQANRFLAATLEIDRLEGSLFRGIELRGVRLSQQGRTIVSIDELALSYTPRELLSGGVALRRLRLVRPRIVAAMDDDGRWNLATLVRRDAAEGERRGPPGPLRVEAIEIVAGTVVLEDPLTFGAARVPSRFDDLNASFSFVYRPVEWRLDFANVAWSGGSSDLTVTRLSGAVANGAGGWIFDDLVVETPESAFTLDGRVRRDTRPTTLDLRVEAARFSFREWAAVVSGLGGVGVEASFDVTLRGPLAKLDTDLTLRSSGGDLRGTFVLDASVPGWRGAGSVALTRFDLAEWLARPDRPSDISGRVDFDLDLRLGQGFPRGAYSFDGAHAAFMGYEGDRVRARGTLTAGEALIRDATARAYGADVRLTASSIGIDAPYGFRFRGAVQGLDLRRLPASIPVPHVESTLAFDYDVTGQFATAAFVAGGAQFAESRFLGASVGAGTRGTIDTSAAPFRYSGEGDVHGIDLHRFGVGLDVAWLQEPRYDGLVSGRFHVEGAGADSRTMTIEGGGRLAKADLFSGSLADGDVAIGIGGGSLTASYTGRLEGIDPSAAFGDPRLAASLTGSGRLQIEVRDLFVTSPQLDDYNVAGTLSLERSSARGIEVDSARVAATLRDGTVTIADLHVEGPALEAGGSGRIELAEGRSEFAYDVARADLSRLDAIGAPRMSGEIVASGMLSGPSDALRVNGTGTVSRLEAAGVRALILTGGYDMTVPIARPSSAAGRVTVDASFVEIMNQAVQRIAGTATYAPHRLGVDVELTGGGTAGLSGALTGQFDVDPERRAVEIASLTATMSGISWRLANADAPPRVTWDEGGLAVSRLVLTDQVTGAQRVGVDGTWRRDGTSALEVTAQQVYLDSFAPAGEGAPRYGGVLDLEATVRGSFERPIVTGRGSITAGRVRRVSYERLAGRVDFNDGLFDVDMRLDQSPGVWLTAAGTIPLALFDRSLPEREVAVEVKSSSVSLGLVEGLTDIVRGVSGQIRIDVAVVGTSADPHFRGTIEADNAAFQVSATGARYRNGVVRLQLATDRITVERVRLEDAAGRPLEVRGSLGTHELRVGAVEIEITAGGFEALRNELGNVHVDADLRIAGQFEAPRLTGRVTIAEAELNLTSILDRTLLQPYSTEVTPIGDAGGVLAPLNVWQRMAVDVELRVPGTMRMTGDDVLIKPGTPLGIGSFNLRPVGDLYLYKDAGGPLSVTGSFSSITGTYTFQGRRFDLDPDSSVTFQGDLNPEISVTVERDISAVQVRVTIAGPLREPELVLASTPPLESSDILSLIVFNAPTNQLTGGQRQELAVRAGTLAAGFLATPLLSALERTLGLDLLQIEAPVTPNGGPRVTIGEEIAPGLVARFSRQFGREEYDEATVEYVLSQILRLRATFSDAGALTARSPFRRIERAGLDLILTFSF